MSEYVAKLKELYNNFSYLGFLDLLKELDKKIINGSILDSEFVYYFKQIMDFVNDKYLVDGQHITLGNMLLDKVLTSDEKITPTLLIYFYLDKKKSLGLEKYCNLVKITDNGLFDMCITSLEESITPDLFQINWLSYEKLNLSNEQFNYKIMHDVIHELTHVYQGTRKEDSDNLFDKLVFYDAKINDIIIRKIFGGSNSGNIVLHDSLLTEYMANETADVYMIEFAKKNSYFSNELIQKKLNYYQRKKSNVFYMYPRHSFEDLLVYIRNTYDYLLGDTSSIQPILDEIENIKTQSLPIIEQLKSQGISENYTDNYYNIFLDSSYSFDGENIVMNDKYVK